MSINLVPPMYKYAEDRWTSALLAEGSVRVGSLEYYRSMEQKRGISDPREGRKELIYLSPQGRFIDGNDSSCQIVRDLRRLGINLQGSTIHGSIQVSTPIVAKNVYVYCVSSRCQAQVMEEFEGADSCVEITDFETFCRLLTIALNKVVPVELTAAAAVIYGERKESWDGRDRGLSPAWLKDGEFQGQYEVRIVWEAIGAKPEAYIDLNCLELVSVMRRVENFDSHVCAKPMKRLIKEPAECAAPIEAQREVTRLTQVAIEMGLAGDMNGGLMTMLKAIHIAATFAFPDRIVPEYAQDQPAWWQFISFLEKRFWFVATGDLGEGRESIMGFSLDGFDYGLGELLFLTYQHHENNNIPPPPVSIECLPLRIPKPHRVNITVKSEPNKIILGEDLLWVLQFCAQLEQKAPVSDAPEGRIN